MNQMVKDKNNKTQVIPWSLAYGLRQQQELK